MANDKTLLQHQQQMITMCPICDLCKKPRFDVVLDQLYAEHKVIASKPIYQLCSELIVCPYHCSCHVTVPDDLGITQVLYPH